MYRVKTIVFIFAIFLCTAALAQSPKGLNVNDKAPLFTAQDQSGKTFSLKEALKTGPVVLVFYRGNWCPYCNRYLKQLEDSLLLIKAKGATLFAVTPEQPAGIGKTISKTKASYPILYDAGLNIMNSYQVAFALDSSTIAKYKKYGIDFNEVNGSNGAQLPVPAVFVINGQGLISYRFFNPDYAKRASIATILEQLD